MGLIVGITSVNAEKKIIKIILTYVKLKFVQNASLLFNYSRRKFINLACKSASASAAPAAAACGPTLTPDAVAASEPVAMGNPVS